MANVQITQLNNAQPLDGTELVPIVQNGVTLKTTTGAIAASPSQQQTFVTVNQEPTLPNSRFITGSNGVTVVDGGSQSTLDVQLTGTASSLESAGAGVIVKEVAGTIVARDIVASGAGVTVTNGDGQAGNPTVALDGLAASLANLNGSGMLALPNNGTVTARTITGTADQITVTNGDGAAGNPTIAIAANPIFPGTGSILLPDGTTAERPNPPVNGMFRYNTDLMAFEGYANGAWGTIVTGAGVSTISGGTTGLTPAVPTSGNVTLGGTLVVANGGTGATTLTGYVKGSGTTPFTASATIPNTDITGLGTMSVQNANSVAITGGTVNGLTNLTVDNIEVDGNTVSVTNTNGDLNLNANGTGITWVNQRWGVNASGTFVPSANATYDIGNGLVNPRDITLTRDLTVGQNINVTGYIQSPTYIQMDTTPGAVTLAEGKMWWDTTGALNIGMGGSAGSFITQQVGEEFFVYGKATSAISDVNLQLVYKTGTVGASGVVTFAPTIAGLTNPDLILGIATESIALNGFGRITSSGIVRGINTTGTVYGEVWADNDAIWYNPVTGGLTKTKPVAPNMKLEVGTVINAGSGGSGSFFVRLGASSTLGGTDSNVQLGSLANGDLLQYNSSLGYWVNAAPSSLAVTSFQTSLSGLTPSTATNGAVTLAGTLGEASGGTGQSSYNTGDLLYASGASALAKLGVGTNGYILTVNAGLPSWQPAPATGVTSFSAGTTGFTPNTSTTGAVTLAGTLSIANGGTNGNAAPTAGTVAYGDGTSYAFTSVGTSGQVLTSNGAGAPTWVTPAGGVTLANDTATSTDLYPTFASATTGSVSTIYTGNARLLYKPSTGELKSTAMVATNGIVVNSATVSESYTIPSGSNAISAGPVTVASSVTVTISSGSVWAIV